MSLEQLNQYKQTQEQQLKEITQHWSHLKQVQVRFNQSKETISSMKKATEGKEVSSVNSFSLSSVSHLTQPPPHTFTSFHRL